MASTVFHYESPSDQVPSAVGLGASILDRRALDSITPFTEQLQIPLGVAASLREGHEVIKLETFSRSALKAPSLVAAPYGVPHRLRNGLAPGWLKAEGLETLCQL